MAWTEITRPKYQRDGLRYASDTTDEEWALIAPHIPPPGAAGAGRRADDGGQSTPKSAYRSRTKDSASARTSVGSR
jgi:hypothetical protein